VTSRLVLVSGVLVDVVMYVPHVPAPGGDVLATHAVVATGGGFNVLAAATRQGLPGAYLGLHGTGRFGDQVRGDLAAEGIALGRPPTPDRDSGFCVGLVDDAAERTYATALGVEVELTPARLAEVPLEPGDTVYLSGYDLAATHSAVVGPWFAALPAVHGTFFDPGPVVGDVDPARLHAVLARADWVSLNGPEACTLTGCDDAEHAARAWGRTLPLPRAGLVVRDGPRGCWLLEAGRRAEVRHVPVPLPPVTPTDSSGAGDCHVGTFAARLAHGDAPLAAARWANVAAAVSVQRVGPATAPTSAEVASLLAATG
jgi:sugar/nucleoside kinase (ribokinase family)